MKRSWLLVIVLSMCILLAACGQKPTSTASPLPSATPPPPQVKTEALAVTATEALSETTAAENTPIATEPAATATEAGPTATEPAPTATEAAPAPQEATPTPASEPAACEDKAAFYDDVTIPDDTAFQQSTEFTKIWRIRNEGTCTWDGYNLSWAGGSLLEAPLTNPIPLTRPGELVDIPVQMRSPVQGGVYTSLWEFENPTTGKHFGVNAGGVDLIWVRISVTWYPEGSSLPGVSTLPTPAGGCTVEKNQAFIDQLLTLINGVRADNGLPALTLDARLSAAAQKHSEDMACKNYRDHIGSDGSDWARRVEAAGYKYSYVSENIYAGDPAFGGDAAGAFAWWMDSQVHRDNILSRKVTQIGIGFAASDNAQYKGRYTLNFARP